MGIEVAKAWLQTAVDAPTSRLEDVFEVRFDHDGEHVVASAPLDPVGTDHLAVGGWGPLVDGVLGRAARAVISPELTLRTINLRVDVVGPRPDGATVSGEAMTLAHDERTAVSRADITVDGSLVGVAVGRFAIQQESGVAGDAAVGESPEVPRSVGELLGIEGTSESADAVEVDLRPSAAMANRYAMMHGGGQVLLVDALLQRAFPSGRGQTLDLSVEYHRPVPVDGSRVRAVVRVTRRGRLVRQADVRVLGEGGRLLVVGRGTYATPPG